MKNTFICLIVAGFMFPILNACSSESSASKWQDKIDTSQAVKDSISNDSITVKPQKDSLTIIGVGDIMLGTIIPSRAYLPPNNDCSPLLAGVKDVLMDADVTFGNLEGVLTDSPVGAKSCSDPSICYTFGMPTAYANCLGDAGFDLISVANNHAGDFGDRGRQSTKSALDKAGLHYAGFLSDCSTVFEHEGVKYGFCAFSPERGSCSFTDYVAAQEIVRDLESRSDIVIVSFHSGREGQGAQHVPRKNEIAFGYNRGDVYKFSHLMIDAGADIIFGHGPHVTRAIEVYKNRFIAYSMGNFCTYSRIYIGGVSGWAPIFKVFVDAEGNFLKAKLFPTYQTRAKGPQLDPQHRVTKKVRELTRSDFPEKNINISDDGWITLPSK